MTELFTLLAMGAAGTEEQERAFDEITRLRAALDVARTALLTVERRCEEGRAELTKAREKAGI